MASSTAGRLTRYVVLKENTADEHYTLVGDTEATSSTTALRQVVSKITDNVAGNYVAIPERSFQVVPIAVKHLEPQLLIGGGEPEKTPKTEKTKTEKPSVAVFSTTHPETPVIGSPDRVDTEKALPQYEDLAPAAR